MKVRDMHEKLSSFQRQRIIIENNINFGLEKKPCEKENGTYIF